MRIFFLAAILLAGAVPVCAFGQHDPGAHDHMQHADAAAPLPTQSGQAAYAAIGEIVALLEADLRTDWSKVDIDALRRHLVDMDNVTLRARVADVPVAGGMRFEVAGDGAVRDSIRRMVAAHAATVDVAAGRHVAVAETADGATMTVTGDAPGDVERIRALGFFGAMTAGNHHQRHHLMIARGEMHH